MLSSPPGGVPPGWRLIAEPAGEGGCWNIILSTSLYCMVGLAGYGKPYDMRVPLEPAYRQQSRG